MAKITRADQLLDDAYKALSLADQPASVKYAALSAIVTHLAGVHALSAIDVGTTGTITERLCVLGLEQVKETISTFGYRRFGKDWKWIGDLLIPGDPYDLAISVKSYKAKERLLASGTGSILTPSVGWGLFNDPHEWSANRTASYLYRGFVSIYMPMTTLLQLSSESRAIRNNTGRPLLRDLANFPSDISSAIIKKTNRVDFRKL